MNQSIDISFVIPCLNEERTLELVVNEIKNSYKGSDYTFEIIVADNGSTDNSKNIAQANDAKVINVEIKGYGAALKSGFKVALGKYIVMGDADGSYKFEDSLKMITLLDKGSDFVIGNRFLGGIERQAMPWLHKYIGNPILSMLGRVFFKIKIKDFHCGLRAFRNESMNKLNLTCDGMEFASEQIVVASRAKLKISEVPIKLYKDKRDRPPHLKTWSDGWRHLRYLLSQSPGWLFLTPAFTALFFSIIFLYIFLINPIKFSNIELSFGTGILFLTFSIISQIIFWIFNSSNLIITGKDTFVNITIERMLVFPLTFLVAGIIIILLVLKTWVDSEFSSLPSESVFQKMILALFFISTGIISASFISLQSIIKINNISN